MIAKRILLNQRFVAGLAFCLLLGSCASLRESAKYKLTDGIYQTTPFGRNKVQITTIGDSIAVAPILHSKDSIVSDSNHVVIYESTVPKRDGAKLPQQRFFNGSFDMDFLTILAKYRPAQGMLPPALHTTTYNGTLFVGYRLDEYNLHYDDSPLRLYKRDQSHYGVSAGAFLGIGATPMSGNVTQPQIDYEYDGFILSSGIAFTVAIQNLTAGIAIGQDQLMDHNHRAWIYNGRPWAGIGIGLNLN